MKITFLTTIETHLQPVGQASSLPASSPVLAKSIWLDHFLKFKDSSHLLRWLLRAGLSIGCLAVALMPTTLRAGLPLPDHIVYGTVAISNQPVTSANTDVTIKACRGTNGPVVISYTMGSTPRLGTNFYELRFQLENGTPSSPQVVLPGDQVVLIVQNTHGIQFTLPYRIPDQGSVERLDFGSSVDTNANGVPDGWELAKLGALTANLNVDPNRKGMTLYDEYIAGTNPKDPTDVFRLILLNSTNRVQVSFLTRAAAGAGYEGRQRFYALESATNLGGEWNPLPNLSRLPGNDHWVIYTEPGGGTNVSSFFRARVWLEGP